MKKNENKTPHIPEIIKRQRAFFERMRQRAEEMKKAKEEASKKEASKEEPAAEEKPEKAAPKRTKKPKTVFGSVQAEA